MENIKEYRSAVLQSLLEQLQPLPEVLAAWEGGSAATGSMDQYSDIDLCLLVNSSLRPMLDLVESQLKGFGISHTWQPQKSSWGEGLMQRVIVLKDSPKYFSVDVAVFDQAYPQMLKDFLEVERHGQLIVYFDKRNLIQMGHTDAEAMLDKQQRRADELSHGFPIFKTLALKEIERGHPIDAIGFYQTGLVRPLIEVLGMIHRPYQFDFGMRYLHKTFPQDLQVQIEKLNYVSQMEDLPAKIVIAEKLFYETIKQVQNRTQL